MKNKLAYIIILLSICVSCSESDMRSDIDNTIYTPVDDKYDNLRSYFRPYILDCIGGCFKPGFSWVEVEYKTNSPEIYTLINYEVVAGGSDGLYLVNENRKALGYIVCEDDTHKVHFQPIAGQKVLLYDFDKNITYSMGLYVKYMGANYHKLMPYDIIDLENMGGFATVTFTSCWRNDQFGGITISGIGSTKGILVPIRTELRADVEHELLKVYNAAMKMNIYENRESEVSSYLPIHFWD